MLKLKDLENRVYSNKECIEFTYIVKDEKQKELLKACFNKKKNGINESQWCLMIVIKRTRDADSQVYNFDYVMPRPNLPLELIAATGLRYFQLYLKQEIQQKTVYDFMLGEALKGM